MTAKSQQDAMDRLRKDVEEERSARAAAQAALAGIANQIRDSVDDTDALNELADSLESDDLPTAIVANTAADPAASPPPSQPTGSSDVADMETRAGAAAAGGYNAPGGAPASPEPTASPVAPNLTAVDEADTNDTGDRVTSQAGREAAGPFTGTGDQDAMRTAGTIGSTDAHHADERTSGDESAVAGNSEDTGTGGNAGTAEDTTASQSGTGDEGSAPAGASTSGAEGDGGATAQPDTTDEGNAAA